MIPKDYKSPTGYTGEERRMDIPKSTDREIGELVATVKALAENSNRQFAELSREMEKLSAQFTEYKADHDKQSAKDYEYLDGKVEKMGHRITNLEDAEKARVLTKKTEESTPFKKFVQKVTDSLGTILAGGIVAFVVWLILLYLKTSGVI